MGKLWCENTDQQFLKKLPDKKAYWMSKDCTIYREQMFNSRYFNIRNYLEVSLFLKFLAS